MTDALDLDGTSDAAPPAPEADVDLDAVREPVRVDRWVWQLPYASPPILVNKITSPMVLTGKRRKARGELGTELQRVFHPWGWDLVDVELVWFRGSNRAADADGTAPTLKPALDALVDAGVLPDDKAAHVHRVSQRIVNADQDPHAEERGPRVLLVVHRLERRDAP